MKLYRWLVLFMFVPAAAWASENSSVAVVTDFTSSIYGYLGLLLFILAYTLVTLENKLPESTMTFHSGVRIIVRFTLTPPFRFIGHHEETLEGCLTDQL